MSVDAAAPVLSIQVEVGFGGFRLYVAEDIALAGVTALFGPSGGGKSTLLRVIAGLERGASGRISFAGESWLDTAHGYFVPAHRRPIGYVFQDARLFAHLTVRGNLHYAASRRPKRRLGIDIAEVIAAFDLTALLERRTHALSGGERQRVAIARTLLTEPRLLLLDEPLAALDVGRKSEILPYLVALPARFGIPAIYVSHALDEVARLADRIVVLVDGRIRATGAAHHILERLDIQPLTGRFEAGSILEARVMGHDAGFHLTRLQLGGEILMMPMVSHLVEGEQIRLRVRARDVALALRRPEDVSIRNVLASQIVTIAEEPDTAFAEILLDIGGSHLRARITRHAAAGLKLQPGMAVFALIKSVAFDRRGLWRPA
jgi:molybdate transport system ATP-binding protein